ncbi:CoA-transferase family III [Xylariomycetidae sp. FL0641]|nr:CoA-transferase family III [Xylariomycetidae sp. FL0641]
MPPYSVTKQVRESFGPDGSWGRLLGSLDSDPGGKVLAAQITQHARDADLKAIHPGADRAIFITPTLQQEALVLLKMAEGSLASMISKSRGLKPGKMSIILDLVAKLGMRSYEHYMDGHDKSSTSKEFKEKLPDTDIYAAQSDPYRRRSANIYPTKDGGGFLLHGSLNPDEVLTFLGLPLKWPDNQRAFTHDDAVGLYEAAVSKFTRDQLDGWNRKSHQAGCPVLTVEEFKATAHGKVMSFVPPFVVKRFGGEVPATTWQSLPDTGAKSKQPLSGIKVIELARIIAGPTIGQLLATLGADVLKVGARHLPDVPFFQIEVNNGKHTASLDLREDSEDRTQFEKLLEDADVIIDGYRHGKIASLGYNEAFFNELAGKRGRGFVYVDEDCYGGSTLGAERGGEPGWQQTADCYSGVCCEQGAFMREGSGVTDAAIEAMIPAFPQADYGTGLLGAIAALVGLCRRATEGGNWYGWTSLLQYDMFLLSLGRLPDEEQQQLIRDHPDFFSLRYHDTVDTVSDRAKQCIYKSKPWFKNDVYMQEAYSKPCNAMIKFPREALSIDGVRIGTSRSTRANDYDKPTWEGFDTDVEPDMVKHMTEKETNMLLDQAKTLS